MSAIGKTINLNALCRVRLTNAGHGRLLERWAPQVNIPGFDASHNYRTQLWSLMQDFGDMMRLGALTNELPFVNNEIEVLDD